MMSTILLLGDSITESFPHADLLSDYTIDNAGVFGDTTELVLLRLERDVLQKNPSAIFLLIGTNDMASGFSNGRTLRNIDAILRRCRKAFPSRRIFLQSILPTRNLEDRPMTRIEFLNLQLRRLARLHSTDYLDIGTLFVNSHGVIDERFSDDGLHLTAAAYRLWAAAIQTIMTGQ
jgi:lysophospholipase L1-like esterase